MARQPVSPLAFIDVDMLDMASFLKDADLPAANKVAIAQTLATRILATVRLARRIERRPEP